MDEVDHEVEILSSLKHTNIVQFIGMKEIEGRIFLVMEYMNHGNLLNFIRDQPQLKEKDLFGIAHQIASGMAYLEEKKVIHK